MINDWQMAHDMPLTIEELIDCYYVAVVRLANSILHNSADAEDAAQEIFVQAQRNLSRFRGDASVKTWLFAIGINHCRRRLRRKRFKEVVLGVLDGAVSAESTQYPEHMTIQNETNRNLWAAVDTLKEKHKLPIILRHVHGLTAREIGETLGISEGTVYSRIHYAQKKLKTLLENEARG